MPKRTNAFQSLVARVFKAREEDHSIVVESQTVTEKGTDTPAEIDILITKTTYGVSLRIALECRDHARPQSIEWIRELSDKKQSMSLNKVVAVSTSGFTKGARQKAQQENIELLSLKEATQRAWQEEFVRIGISQVTWTGGITGLKIHFSGSLPSGLTITSNSELTDTSGKPVGSLGSFINGLCASQEAAFHSALQAGIVTTYKTMEDLKKPLQITHNIKSKKALVLGENLIESFDVTFTYSTSLLDVAMDHFVLGQAQVSQGIIDAAESSVSIAAVQWKDQAGKVAVSVQRVDPATGAGRRVSPRHAKESEDRP